MLGMFQLYMLGKFHLNPLIRYQKVIVWGWVVSSLVRLEPSNSIKCSLPNFFLQACLDEFTHHNIDVACNLLETCGRFLYRSPETTLRMTNMLDILMRLKNVKNLDPRQSTLVENAYYLCKPPERSARISKVRPPLHQVLTNLQLQCPLCLG